MFHELILLHRPGPQAFEFKASFGFNTCLRKIAVGDGAMLAEAREHLRDDDEVYRGEDAYRFLLQVICGLHSPLIGETEVYGQFKNAVASCQLPVSPLGTLLKRFFQLMFEDAKRIRLKHLEDLGSQSYGSVVRREIKDICDVHVIGAGHLVQEVLPWICKDGKLIRIHARDPEKAARELKEPMKEPVKMSFHGLDNVNSDFSKNCEALILAAPVSAKWVAEWLAINAAAPGLIIDLRADSHQDLIELPWNPRLLKLTDVFASISSNQEFLLARKREALAAVDACVRERGRYVEYRPFGWEDVCA